MPRYQPPIITGGGREAPTWSELASYYLPQQQGMERPSMSPIRPSGLEEHYRQMYANRPIEQSPPRYRRPEPWTSANGPSAYDEIMSRLTAPRQSSVPDTPPPSADSNPTGEIPSTGRFTGMALPEGWQNGDPGHGAARAHVMMQPDQIEARRAQDMAAAALSELGYGDGTGTGQFADIQTGGGGNSGVMGLGEAMTAGSYDPFNTQGTGVNAQVGATNRQDWDPNQGWTAATAGRPSEGLDWEAIGFWLRVAAGDPIATYDALTGNVPGSDRRRRNNSDTNRESASDREVNTNE